MKSIKAFFASGTNSATKFALGIALMFLARAVLDPEASALFGSSEENIKAVWVLGLMALVFWLMDRREAKRLERERQCDLEVAQWLATYDGKQSKDQ